MICPGQSASITPIIRHRRRRRCVLEGCPPRPWPHSKTIAEKPITFGAGSRSITVYKFQQNKCSVCTWCWERVLRVAAQTTFVQTLKCLLSSLLIGKVRRCRMWATEAFSFLRF